MPAQNNAKSSDNDIQWVRSSAEYQALAIQAYAEASRDLDRFIANTSWSALPGQTDAGELPPAIIADVDETVVSNADFQAAFQPPFTDRKLADWNIAHEAKPVPGVVEFLQRAQSAGVEIFFVTNRPCATTAGDQKTCPLQAVTLKGLHEIGSTADTEHVMLANARPDWGNEKSTRRNQIARTHRVIMLFGDDLSDFIACSLKKRRHPCPEGATAASRQAAVLEFSHYWGEGWYILPNPMHGSWTTFN